MKTRNFPLKKLRRKVRAEEKRELTSMEAAIARGTRSKKNRS